MAAHKLSSTLALGPFKALQKNTVTAIVTKIAINEMEQPTVEMISKAFLWDFPPLKEEKNQRLARI